MRAAPREFVHVRKWRRNVPAERMQVFAIIRVDQVGKPLTKESLEIRVNVKEIVRTLEEAESEVDRLNGLNGDEETVYFLAATRYYPDGRG